MKALVLALALVAAPTPQNPEKQLAPESGARVEVRDLEGLPLLSIEAREVPIRSLLPVIAAKLHVDLTGVDYLVRNPTVNVFLHERPYDDAIRWTLGSVGLRADVNRSRIHVYEDVPPYPDAAALFQEADRRYLQALRDHPEWPLADRAEMSRARINEELGPDFFGAAALAYETLIDSYPTSDLVPEASLRLARMLDRLGRWEQAVVAYETLASLPVPHPYHVTARLELALSLCHAGEATDDRSRQQDAGTKAPLLPRRSRQQLSDAGHAGAARSLPGEVARLRPRG